MSEPVFSIIIPLFNREHLVHDTIHSLFLQTETNWEAVIVDDGSTDKSREVVKNYAASDRRIILLERPADRPKGPSSCRNIGFQSARGRFVYYLDSDDLLEKHFCENAAREFHKNSKLDFLGVQCIYFSGSVDELLKQSYPPQSHHDEIRTHYLEKSLWVQTESFCWRKSFLDRFPDHWPEDQRVGEDRVCYYRILTQPCFGTWETIPVQVYHRTGNPLDRRNDQLTPQVNRNPRLAAERVLTVRRLIEAFRNSNEMTAASETLLLSNALYALRGVLSYNHTDAAEECFRQLSAFAREINRPEFIRKAKWYMRLKCLFRFHRIPFVEKCYGLFRHFFGRERL